MLVARQGGAREPWRDYARFIDASILADTRVARMEITCADNSYFSMFLAAAAYSCAATANVASTNVVSPAGVAYATGAVSNEDMQMVAGERGRYSLWVTTATRGSGAYLSDAMVKIRDADDAVVLETMM